MDVVVNEFEVLPAPATPVAAGPADRGLAAAPAAPPPPPAAVSAALRALQVQSLRAWAH